MNYNRSSEESGKIRECVSIVQTKPKLCMKEGSCSDEGSAVE